jgi:diaminohydroxyphosphoribosylaminopyrimidine deaminase/5-amino-6-(5-phosphoribosylamino)uracil reductase
MESKDDQYYMKKTLQLAKKGEGYTSPNPMVGALVVKNGEIIGKGYHKKAGEPHAEVYALDQAGNDAEGATLYVNLEPCCHFGKTPACSLKVIKSGIKRLVVAMEDPNPLVAGEGIRQLEQAGIETKVGVLEKEAEILNEVFIKYITENIPFIYLKSGQTIDGFLATSTGDSRWVTNKKARLYGHKLRHKVDAILVGVNTVLNDNPRLTTRLVDKTGIDPIRVVLDSKLKTPIDADIINQESESKTIIATTSKYNKDKYNKLQTKDNLEITIVEQDKKGRINLVKLLENLAKKEITSILVEGGGTINYSFLHKGLADKLYAFIAPKLLGGNDGIYAYNGNGVKKMNNAFQLKDIQFEMTGDNILIIGEIE